ncbi:hypothetical protein [Kitasatospora sp. NPDC017646]|uniref:hypothetical protein n=1 Tax=Kitasatospora sp. NPDC017646 TaxID=3364024 RepID=UPI0037B21F57
MIPNPLRRPALGNSSISHPFGQGRVVLSEQPEAPGQRSLLDALGSPDTREAYDERQKARDKKARQAHRELMGTLACVD